MDALTRFAPRILRPACAQLRSMAVGSGAGDKTGVSEAGQAISKANMEASHRAQIERAKEMGADRGGGSLYPEPHPTSQAVPGLTSEFQADQEYTITTAPKSPEQDKPASPSQQKPVSPTTAFEKVKDFVKESVSTMTHGVNNAGQPEIQEELKKK